MSCIYRRKY